MLYEAFFHEDHIQRCCDGIWAQWLRHTITLAYKFGEDGEKCCQLAIRLVVSRCSLHEHYA
jgi:hypothetical protein